MFDARLTLTLLILVLIAAIAMWNTEPVTTGERELIQFCDSDYCTTAAGAFWAKQDSLDAHRFFNFCDSDYCDESLPPEEGA